MHDFTAHCLDKNPNARLSPAELLKHPFLERARDNIYMAHRLLGAAPQQQLRSTRSFAVFSDGTPRASEVRASTVMADTGVRGIIGPTLPPIVKHHTSTQWCLHESEERVARRLAAA